MFLTDQLMYQFSLVVLKYKFTYKGLLQNYQYCTKRNDITKTEMRFFIATFAKPILTNKQQRRTIPLFSAKARKGLQR